MRVARAAFTMRFGNVMLPFLNWPWKEKSGFSVIGVAATSTEWLLRLRKQMPHRESNNSTSGYARRLVANQTRARTVGRQVHSARFDGACTAAKSRQSASATVKRGMRKESAERQKRESDNR